jgi:ElaB/YqjD/DUF883 family membrane-anchored ribosome-binding protein
MICQANLHSTCIGSGEQHAQERKAGKRCVRHLYFVYLCLFRSVTLVGESDRKMLKAAIKRGSGNDKVRHRVIPADALAQWKAKLDELKDEVEAVLKEEKEEKVVSIIKHAHKYVHAKPFDTVVATSRNGTKKRSKHDRARGRDLCQASKNLVSVVQGEAKGRRSG